MTSAAKLVLEADTTDLTKAVATMQTVATQADKTEAAVVGMSEGMTASIKSVPPALAGVAVQADKAGLAAMSGGINIRMMSQQLSQVAQQGAVTGNWLGALAVQLPDIGLAFGAVGTAVGVLAMVGLPLLQSVLGNSTSAMDAFNKKLDDATSAVERAKKAATEAGSSFDNLAKKYGVMATQAQAYLNTIAEFDRVQAVTAMTAAVDALTTSVGALYNKGGEGRGGGVSLTPLGGALELNIQQAKEMQSLLDALDTSVGLKNQALAAQQLYTWMIATYGSIDGMPPKAQALAEALAKAGLETIDLQQNTDVLGGYLQAAKGFADELWGSQPGSGWLSGPIAQVETLAGKWLAAAQAAHQALYPGSSNLSFGSMGGAGAGGTLTGFDFMGDMSSQLATLTPIAAAVTGLGGAAGSAAPAVKGVSINLQDLIDQAHPAAAAIRDMSQALPGLESTLKSFGSGDISGGLSGIGSLGKTLEGIGGGLGSIGTAIAGFAPELALAGFIFDAFQTKTTLLSDSLQGTVTALGVTAEEVDKVKKSSFFGLFNSTSTTTTSLTSDSVQALNDAFTAMQSSVESAAAVLGIGTSAFDQFSYNFNVDLKGMTDEQKSQAIANAFGGAANAMAALALAGLEIPASAGGAAAYLTELGNSLVAVNNAAQMLGYPLSDISVASGAAADAIVNLYGSLSDFTNATDYYFQNFYNQSEQLASVSADLQSQLGSLGVTTIPTTTDAFKALVDTFQQAGDLEAVAALIQLAPEMSNFIDLINQLADASAQAAQAIEDQRTSLQDQLYTLQGNTAALRQEQLDALDPSNQALQEQVWALQDQQAAADAAAQSLNDMTAAAQQLADSLDKSTFKSLFDYQVAYANALYGVAPTASTPATVAAATFAAATSTDASMAMLQAILDAINGMASNAANVGASSVAYALATKNTLDKWDGDGMPSVRT
jgi:polyhydroxyalkanoate synthesis regulator phasin